MFFNPTLALFSVVVFVPVCLLQEAMIPCIHMYLQSWGQQFALYPPFPLWIQ